MDEKKNNSLNENELEDVSGGLWLNKKSDRAINEAVAARKAAKAGEISAKKKQLAELRETIGYWEQ